MYRYAGKEMGSVPKSIASQIATSTQRMVIFETYREDPPETGRRHPKGPIALMAFFDSIVVSIGGREGLIDRRLT